MVNQSLIESCDVDGHRKVMDELELGSKASDYTSICGDRAGPFNGSMCSQKRCNLVSYKNYQITIALAHSENPYYNKPIENEQHKYG